MSLGAPELLIILLAELALFAGFIVGIVLLIVLTRRK